MRKSPLHTVVTAAGVESRAMATHWRKWQVVPDIRNVWRAIEIAGAYHQIDRPHLMAFILPSIGQRSAARRSCAIVH
jgi:hypothetical protein